MKITDLSQLVARKETGKKEVSIAQIKEIIKVIDEILEGELYKLVRKIK